MSTHEAPEQRLRRARGPRVQDRSTRDLIVAGALVCTGSVLFITMDAVEWLSPALREWEPAEIDDVLLSLTLAVAVAAWFSFRRFVDSRAQAAELWRIAEERERYMSRLEALSSQLLSLEERERNRLAEALHDEIGQALYACQLKLDLVASGPRADAGELVAQARELTSAAMTRARDLSVQLSPPELHDLGIADAMESLVRRLERRFGLSMRFAPGAAWGRIPTDCHSPVFQSVAELAVNAAKHANASEVVLSAKIEPQGTVKVLVTDDGTGFDPSSTRQRGFGLFSIERRMACIGGTLEIDSRPNEGTTAVLRLAAAELEE